MGECRHQGVFRRRGNGLLPLPGRLMSGAGTYGEVSNAGASFFNYIHGQKERHDEMLQRVMRGEAEPEFTPRFGERSQHMRFYDTVTEDEEEQNFREFLDVLANPQDRLAATWLWLRGRS